VSGADASIAGSSRFTRTQVLTAVAIAAAVLVAIVYYGQQRRELARADLARAEEIRAESRSRRQVDNETRTAELDARVEMALQQLQSDRPTIQCNGALQLGRIGTKANVSDLNTLVYSATPSVRICAAGALLDLGETGTALGIYEMWSRETDVDLRNAAIGGFGDIGPAASDVALPFLEREMRSEFWSKRYLVVATLAKLGPAADALLTEAARDPNETVREAAANVLKSRRAKK
jgi:HEAT repeat protein